jgi:hypothetical protein
MRRLLMIAGVTLIGAITTAKADDTKPPAADLTGTWNMRFPVVVRSPGGRHARGVPVCVLQQAGNQLSGTCKIVDRGEGPVTGTVDGQHVELKWNFKFYPYMRAHSSPADDDLFAVTTFKGDLDSATALHGHYQSEAQLGWNRVFRADKQPA